MNVLTLGDSLAYGAGDESGGGIAARLKSELPGVTTTNFGVNGAVTADLRARLKQERVRKAVEGADAIVLSIGANDLFRSPGGREATLRDPFGIAEKILGRVEEIVRELHTINPKARILILGAYNPVPTHPLSFLINQYIGMWDAAVATRFARDRYVSLVKMSDVVTRDRLSHYDFFHPGAQAYAAAAKRIATMLTP